MLVKKLSKILDRGIDNAKLENLTLLGFLYRISVSEDDGYFISKALNLFIDKHIIPSWNNNYRLNPHPKDSESILISGDGVHFIKVNGIHAVVSIDKKAKGVFDPSTDKIINIYGLKWQLPEMKKALGSLFDIGFNLPKLYKQQSNGYRDRVGYVSDIYKKQEQYIQPAVYDEVCSVVERMIAGREWYAERLLPYKETIILKGPPRTGKTNLTRHLASKYNLDLIVANPNNIASIGELDKLTLVLIEELDAYSYLCIDGEDKVVKEDSGDNTITPSAKKDPQTPYADFINHLCGVVPLDNIILIITTNNYDKLRPSVVGKGRINRRIQVDHLSKEQVLKMLGNSSKYNPIIDMDFKPGDINAAMMPELRQARNSDEVSAILTRA